MKAFFAWIDRQPRLVVGPIVLGGTLLGCLPQVDAFLNFGNQTWQSAHIMEITFLGCVFSLLHIIVLVILLRAFRRIPVIACICILLVFGNAYGSWHDLICFATPAQVSPFWRDLDLMSFWSVEDFLRLLAVFVMVPCLAYVGLVGLMDWLGGAIKDREGSQ